MQIWNKLFCEVFDRKLSRCQNSLHEAMKKLNLLLFGINLFNLYLGDIVLKTSKLKKSKQTNKNKNKNKNLRYILKNWPNLAINIPLGKVLKF